MLQTGYTVASLKVVQIEVGNSISMQNLSQIGGTVCALVIAGQIFQSDAIDSLTRSLSGHGFSSTEIRDAVAGSQSQLFVQLTGDLRKTAFLAVTNAIRKAFILNVSAGAMLILVGLLMKTERLLD
jgi:hypothetical protein